MRVKFDLIQRISWDEPSRRWVVVTTNDRGTERFTKDPVKVTLAKGYTLIFEKREDTGHPHVHWSRRTLDLHPGFPNDPKTLSRFGLKYDNDALMFYKTCM